MCLCFFSDCVLLMDLEVIGVVVGCIDKCLCLRFMVCVFYVLCINDVCLTMYWFVLCCGVLCLCVFGV